LRRLELAPAFLAGASAGARVSYLTAVRHPDVVAGLVLWSVSGGPYGSQNLGYDYHVPFINTALRGGVEAVADMPFFRERIRENPANRDRLLSTPTDQFVAAFRSWNESFFYRPDTPVIAATKDDLRRIACPTLVFEGNDDMHPPEAAIAFHQLVESSRLAPLPWTRDEFMDRLVGRVPGAVMDLYPRLVPIVLDFLADAELHQGAPRR
jgi:pimeloyl-ACP methyl ester carboxylesterase